MKKVFLSMAAVAMLFTACNDDKNDIEEQSQIDMSDFYVYTDADTDEAGRMANSKDNKKSCHAMVNLNRMLNENPGLEKKMYDVEYHTRKFIAAKKGGNGNGNGNGGGNDGGDNGGGDPVDDGLGTLNIPVYVYVIYANNNQNISDAQVNSQISVLNNDFNDTDFSDVRSQFQGLGADVDINFDLQIVNRIFDDSRSDWGLNDAVKAKYPAVPGYLTMWVANLPSGYLGYAQFPGGAASTDGVVMSPQYFGSADYDNQGNFYLDPQFNLGRTTTHEVGHWMNLRHIWGDGRCRQDDFVSDTPASDAPNYGCALSHASCRSTDMVENYMDYSDDYCMGLFTEGQKARMRAVFAPGGFRASLVGN